VQAVFSIFGAKSGSKPPGLTGDAAAYLAAIVDSSSDAIIGKDLSGRVTSWNKAAESMFGFEADEIIGKPIQVLFPSDRLEEEDLLLDQIRSGERVEHFETMRRRKDGREIPVSLTVSPIRDVRGVIVGASKIARDISERIERDHALQESEGRFRRAVEAAPNALIGVGAGGRIELVNAAAEQMFGYERAELLGQAIDMLVPQRVRQDHPTLHGAFFAAPRPRLMGLGRDLYALRKDGSEFPVEIGLNPIETAKGVSVLSAIVDLSERRRAELALKRSEERYRRIIDQSPLGIVLIDSETGRVEQANAAFCEMLDCEADEIVGQTLEQRVHPEDQPPAATETPQALLEQISREKRYLAKSGAPIWTRASVAWFPAEAGRAAQLLAFVENTTERKQAERQLLQAQKMESIGQLTGGSPTTSTICWP
jgi:PAS domain S-box-containing protein